MRASVVLDDAVIRSGAFVDTAIVDVATTVGTQDRGVNDQGSTVKIFSGDDAR